MPACTPATLPHPHPPTHVHTGAVTCDAHHMTDPHPEGLGVSTCIELALKDSGIERDEVRGPAVLACTCTAIGSDANQAACGRQHTIALV